MCSLDKFHSSFLIPDIMSPKRFSPRSRGRRLRPALDPCHQSPCAGCAGGTPTRPSGPAWRLEGWFPAASWGRREFRAALALRGGRWGRVSAGRWRWYVAAAQMMARAAGFAWIGARFAGGLRPPAPSRFGSLVLAFARPGLLRKWEGAVCEMGEGAPGARGRPAARAASQLPHR